MSDFLQRAFGLEGKVALITGAREGIGAAAALAFAEAGARVAITSRTTGGLASIADAVRAAGSDALPLAMEMRDLETVRAGVEETARHFGRLDVLVNNAGIAIRADSLTYTDADWAEVTEVDLRGPFFAAQSAAALMARAGGGRIINVSSVFAHRAMGLRAAYAASKAGLEQMTKVLAVEWAKAGITVNAVAPGTVLTPTREHLFPTPEALAERLRLIPLGRLGAPEDIAPAILFLASPAASWITGAVINIDGGMRL
ncbi:MAG TPA: glucose 1-dehydrogenase [Candidatus Dormibacteraeota bacterium]